MTKDARTRRFPLVLTDEESTAVREYRWRNRIETQTEAIRKLIAKGLEAESNQGEAA